MHYDAYYDAETLRAERLAASGQDAILDQETIFKIPTIFPSDFIAKPTRKNMQTVKPNSAFI